VWLGTTFSGNSHSACSGGGIPLTIHCDCLPSWFVDWDSLLRFWLLFHCDYWFDSTFHSTLIPFDLLVWVIGWPTLHFPDLIPSWLVFHYEQIPLFSVFPLVPPILVMWFNSGGGMGAGICDSQIRTFVNCGHYLHSIPDPERLPNWSPFHWHSFMEWRHYSQIPFFVIPTFFPRFMGGCIDWLNKLWFIEFPILGYWTGIVGRFD